MGQSIAINGGFIGQRVTGLQRYAWEVCGRIAADERVRVIYPARSDAPQLPARALFPASEPPLFSRVRVAWDLALPLRLKRGELLWSPCNLGPPIRNHAVTMHDLAVIRNPGWFSRGFAAKYRLLVPLLVRRSRLIITDTETVRNELCEYCPAAEAKVTVAPLGVSAALMQCASLPVPPDLVHHVERPYYVALGSIDPRKNLAFLLQEWDLHQRSHPGQRLLVIGGSSAAFRRCRLQCPPDCEFLGYLPDRAVAPLIKGARGLIYPSLYEGFSIPPLEALALGTPALVSDIPVHRENFSEWAYFFDPTRRGSLCELLEEGGFRVRSPATLAAAMASKFNWDRCAGTILASLEACCAHA